MRYFLIAILCLTLAIHYAHGESTAQLGMRLVPNKIMENTEGIVQVYSNSADMVKVDNLIATSSDSSIIQILGIEKEKDSYVTDVKIKAITSGSTKIALAAPGFLSQEFPITVYKNTVAPANLLIKATPSTFSSNGPNLGYVTVELVNSAGSPTFAGADTPITITSSDFNTVNVKTSQVVISKGSYYAVGQFEIKQQGTAQISASSPSLSTVSTTITINDQNSQQTLQVYVYPKKINAFSAAYGYVVVQLHDSSGNPVQAKDDIPVRVQITNSSGIESINTSQQNTLIQANQDLVIKKDSYWGYIPISVNAGLNGVYNVAVSAKGYAASTPAQITTIAQTCSNTNHAQVLDCTSGALYDDKSARVDILPILGTGQNELIGIMHLEDTSGDTIMVKGNLLVHVDSSDLQTLSVDDVNLSSGSQAAPVFGTVGTFAKSVTLNVVTENPQTITAPIVSGTTGTSTSIVAESLIPKILSHTDFPLAIYITNDGALDVFKNNETPLISPNDVIQTEQSTISQGESIKLLKSSLLKEDSQSISVTTQDYTTSASIDGLSANPQALVMDYPEKIFANSENTFSIEMLDSQQSPLSVDNDMEVKLVSSDPSIITTPDTVKVTKGNYYATFNVQSKNGGIAELSVLGNGLPLTKYTISVITLTPIINIVGNDYVNRNTNYEATATISYNNVPLPGVDVSWNVQGGQIQSKDSVTDSNGNAKISLVVQDPNKMTIQVSAQGGIYGSGSASKDVNVNTPLEGTTQTSDSQTGGESMMNVLGINPLFIIIPVAAGVGGFFVLKKKNMLDGISEKITFIEKFSEIKEKISELRER